MPPKLITRQYLGDGVYADLDDAGIVLTAEDGTRVTDRIVLEPDVWTALMRYVDALQRATKEWSCQPN